VKLKASSAKLSPAALFIIKFLCLFGLLYGFYIGYLSITAPGGYYNAFLDNHLNFIAWLRYLLIETSAAILNLLGYQTKTASDQMLVAGHNIVYVGYDCLGFGVMCFFTAFVLTYPGIFKIRLLFLVTGLICIQLINLARFVILSLYWHPSNSVYLSDHHTIFNIIVYILIGVSLYFYIHYQDYLLLKRSKA
jgi:exosortase/archaeosortase family protein